jgi:hypothetical protein
MSYEEEDTCMSFEEEDTCMSYEEETCMSYEEEDMCMPHEERFHLRLQNGKPELAGLDTPPHSHFARLLVLLVQGLKLGTVAVCEAGSLHRAKERPVAIGLASLHKKICLSTRH